MDWQASKAVREVLEQPILVIGCGSIGRRHIKNLLELGAKKVYAVEPDFGAIENLSVENPAVHIYPHLNATRGLNPIAAIICTPTNEHNSDMVRCYNDGIWRLFIEKPMTTSLFASRWINTRAEPTFAANTFVACNFRFTPGLQRVKQFINDGAIGKVVSARAQFGQYLPDMRPNADHKKVYAANKSMGGGCLLDGIHEFDYTAWLFGGIAEVRALTARVGDVTIDTEDCSEAICRYSNGALGSIHADYLRPRYGRYLEVVGTEGVLEWDYKPKKELLFLDNELIELGSNELDHANRMYVEEMQHFLRVCAGEEKSMNTVADAYRLLETILNAK